MEELIEILKFIIPSLIVFAVVYVVMKAFLDKESKRIDQEFRKQGHKIITPIKLQAYERIILFLERISPHNLVLRVSRSGLSADQYRMKLLNTIREEFEHNLSQQLYISNHAWDLVKNTKEEIVKLINTADGKLMEKDKAGDLGQKIIELSLEQKISPVSRTIEYIKQEVNDLF